MNATFCWDKGPKASNLTADSWDASVYSFFLQKRLTFACAMIIICATLHCGTQQIKALALKCWSLTGALELSLCFSQTQTPV